MTHMSTREIKTRIRSMESTRQITRAMEMVASSGLRRAQTQAAAFRPYFEIICDAIDQITAASEGRFSPYLMKRTGKPPLFLVIAGDRGLAGGYNSSVLKLALHEMARRNAAVLPIGKKAADRFREGASHILTEEWSEASRISIDDCFRIAEYLASSYLEGKFSEIHLVSTRFVSLLNQSAVSRQLLPLNRNTAAGTHSSRCLALPEPDVRTVLDTIIPDYMAGVLYEALIESRCAEHAARRTAMDSATRNAGDIISDLRQTWNRVRQAAITQEITEIVAGIEP